MVTAKVSETVRRVFGRPPMVVPAGLLEELAQISEAATVAGGLLSPTTYNDAQLGGPPSYGSDYLLSNVFGNTFR
jgi:hypothetical protein